MASEGFDGRIEGSKRLWTFPGLTSSQASFNSDISSTYLIHVLAFKAYRDRSIEIVLLTPCVEKGSC